MNYKILVSIEGTDTAPPAKRVFKEYRVTLSKFGLDTPVLAEGRSPQVSVELLVSEAGEYRIEIGAFDTLGSRFGAAFVGSVKIGTDPGEPATFVMPAGFSVLVVPVAAA